MIQPSLPITATSTDKWPTVMRRVLVCILILHQFQDPVEEIVKRFVGRTAVIAPIFPHTGLLRPTLVLQGELNGKLYL